MLLQDGKMLFGSLAKVVQQILHFIKQINFEE